MKLLAHRMFYSPRRLWLTIGCTFLGVMVVMATVLAVRIDRTLGSIPHAKPSVEMTTEPLDMTPVTPTLTTRDQEYIDSPPADVFADLGDPTPRVLAAVDAWVDGDIEGMQKRYLPAALDDVIGNPPGNGFRLTGEPVVAESGPTRSVLRIPTSAGMLEIVAVGVDGQWMIESMGYLPK